MYDWENLHENFEKVSLVWVNLITNYFSGDLGIHALEIKELMFPGSFFYDIHVEHPDLSE